MSSLGIRFVLPYVGSNGVKITNNSIGLDPNALASLGGLILNENLSLPGAFDYVLKVFSSNGTGINPIGVYDEVSNLLISTNNDGSIDNTNAGGINTNTLNAIDYVTGQVLVNSNDVLRTVSGIQFNTTGGGQNVIVKNQQADTVVAALNKCIPIVINGVTYKLIIAV